MRIIYNFKQISTHFVKNLITFDRKKGTRSARRLTNYTISYHSTAFVHAQFHARVIIRGGTHWTKVL